MIVAPPPWVAWATRSIGAMCGRRSTLLSRIKPHDLKSKNLRGKVMLPIRTILYSTGYSKYSEYAFTDYSEHSEYAFQVACELARDYEARLIVLHVVDTIKSPRGRGDDRQVGSSWSGNDRDSLRKKLYRLKSADPAVGLVHQLREGSPVEEILRAADEDQCDLIVMVRTGRLGWTGC